MNAKTRKRVTLGIRRAERRGWTNAAALLAATLEPEDKHFAFGAVAHVRRSAHSMSTQQLLRLARAKGNRWSYTQRSLHAAT